MASKRLVVGQRFPEVNTNNIHANPIRIPDSDSDFVHLQFRRFAGCPICNLHLQSFIKRNDELRACKIKEVVVFHSSDKKLLPYQGSFPFDVIGDPTKELYKAYGVESSPFAVLHPAAIPAIFDASVHLGNFKPDILPEGGKFGLPADFLITRSGVLKAVHYGAHAADHWSVDDLLSRCRS